MKENDVVIVKRKGTEGQIAVYKGVKIEGDVTVPMPRKSAEAYGDSVEIVSTVEKEPEPKRKTKTVPEEVNRMELGGVDGLE